MSVHGRTRDDEVVVAAYCSRECAENADEPSFGEPWPWPVDDLRYFPPDTTCPCGKRLPLVENEQGRRPMSERRKCPCTFDAHQA